MGRVAAIVSTYLALIVVTAVAGYRATGAEARNSGLALYQHRAVLKLLDGAKPNPPDVLWLGDSTIMTVPSYPSYTDIVEHDVLQPFEVTSLRIGAPGIDSYAYWSLAGRIAELYPKVVVLVANLRTFMPEGGARGLTDLTAEIPIEDLPRTVALPFSIRGMSIPRLLLARALRTELGEDVFLTSEGLRQNIQEADAFRWLGPVQREAVPGEQLERFATMADRILMAFDRPITPSNALVRFTGATVARLAASGSTVLVLVTPIPWERGMEANHYDPSRALARIATLRDAVESNGGRLLDLRHALTKPGFRDVDCHMSTSGAADVAKLVAPEVFRVLVQRGDLKAPPPKPRRHRRTA